MRAAPAVALAKGDPNTLATILGLPGVPLRAWFVGDEMEQRHVGLGVYRHECPEDRGFVFASLLAPTPSSGRCARRWSSCAVQELVETVAHP